uniref:Uncharacterized protein LOC111101620 isoform X3 n=1 Tax=Crassostrea virginica TaxID=6565 RepID=A0A8B8AEP9_CRAVI|nr:uncharacterized protein LOC111101620 isoform X3 [Crassostrea virginica]
MKPVVKKSRINYKQSQQGIYASRNFPLSSIRLHQRKAFLLSFCVSIVSIKSRDAFQLTVEQECFVKSQLWDKNFDQLNTSLAFICISIILTSIWLITSLVSFCILRYTERQIGGYTKKYHFINALLLVHCLDLNINIMSGGFHIYHPKVFYLDN